LLGGDIMSITVGKLFGNGAVLYQMKLIAGNKGINKLVEWVHKVCMFYDYAEK